MGVNWEHKQREAHRKILKAGGAGKLRRSGVDRDCVCSIVEFKPYERGLVVEGARRALISVLDPNGAALTTPPNAELDKLVFGGEVLQIIPPIGGPRPAGTIVYYDAQVLYESVAA